MELLLKWFSCLSKEYACAYAKMLLLYVLSQMVQLLIGYACLCENASTLWS